MEMTVPVQAHRVAVPKISIYQGIQYILYFFCVYTYKNMHNQIFQKKALSSVHQNLSDNSSANLAVHFIQRRIPRTTTMKLLFLQVEISVTV